MKCSLISITSQPSSPNSPKNLSRNGVYGFGLIGIILVIAGAVVSGGQKEVYHNREVKGDDNPLDILKKRLAKGEISQDEYNKLKKEFE